MIYGYAREVALDDDEPDVVSLRDQGRAIVSYCQRRLRCKFDPKCLFLDTFSKKWLLQVKFREAASALLNRAKKGDHIVVHSFSHLFLSQKDIATWSGYLKESQVTLHIAARNKSILELTSEEMLDCIKEANAERRRHWPKFKVVSWTDVPAEKARWIDKGQRRNGERGWIKVVEMEGRVVQVAEH
jgi:DNA invertase Pin-like site-specific DNA recombinase